MSFNEDSSDEDTPATQTRNNDTNDLTKIFPIKLTHNKILNDANNAKLYTSLTTNTK